MNVVQENRQMKELIEKLLSQDHKTDRSYIKKTKEPIHFLLESTDSKVPKSALKRSNRSHTPLDSERKRQLNKDEMIDFDTIQDSSNSRDRNNHKLMTPKRVSIRNDENMLKKKKSNKNLTKVINLGKLKPAELSAQVKQSISKIMTKRKDQKDQQLKPRLNSTGNRSKSKVSINTNEKGYTARPKDGLVTSKAGNLTKLSVNKRISKVLDNLKLPKTTKAGATIDNKTSRRSGLLSVATTPTGRSKSGNKHASKSSVVVDQKKPKKTATKTLKLK